MHVIIARMQQMTPPMSPRPPAGQRSTSKWGQERRLEFIDWRLRWDGQINRVDLTEFFGISIPQASLDLAKYLEMAPKNAVYDRSAKVYLPGPEFSPLFGSNSPQRYLNELLARATDVLPPELSFLGWMPSVDLAPVPGRRVPAEVLLPILQAIRSKRRVVVSYQSVSSLEPTERTLSPHAVAHDGFRWHVRAYCDRREQFLDFVVARILSVTATSLDSVDSAKDEAWHRMVTLRLGPNPALPLAVQKVIELDYGMQNGSVELPCRQALLFYTLRHLDLLDGHGAPPEVQQIALLNREEVAPFLPATNHSR